MNSQITGFLSPVSLVTNSTIEKKSRLITTISPASSKTTALSCIGEVTSREVGANHNCYAYIIGNPFNPTNLHCSDDGEPSGTAGKPMLNILQHENLGNIVVVVTRYFGGVKLGSGGLVRAYSGGLKAALEKAELKEYIQSKILKLRFDYRFEGNIRYCCDSFGAAILGTTYSSCPEFTVQLVEDKVEAFTEKLGNMTSGGIEIDWGCEKE